MLGDNLDTIVEMRRSGMTLQEIGDEFDVSATAVYEVLPDEMRAPSDKPSLDEEAICIAYQIPTIKVKTIMSTYGIKNTTHLYNILNRNGITFRRRTRKAVDPAAMDEAIELYSTALEMTIRAICNQTGVDQPYLHAELKARNVTLRRDMKKKRSK